ncbi:MAG: cation transporter [Clostridia bacterium]|nr:cation transporter [Clostridia bacterium]
MKKIILKVDGMSCGMCEAHVNDAVRRTANVKKVSSSHTKGLTEIILDNEIDLDAVKRAIEETGYKVLSVSEEQYEKKGLFSILKK